MSDKIMIIRNCPSTYQNFEDKFVCTSQIKQKGFPFYCQDCTDCVMKQIVVLCKEDYTSENNIFDVSKKLFAQRILDLLDIQEVE